MKKKTHFSFLVNINRLFLSQRKELIQTKHHVNVSCFDISRIRVILGVHLARLDSGRPFTLTFGPFFVHFHIFSSFFGKSAFGATATRYPPGGPRSRWTPSNTSGHLLTWYVERGSRSVEDTYVLPHENSEIKSLMFFSSEHSNYSRAFVKEFIICFLINAKH